MDTSTLIIIIAPLAGGLIGLLGSILVRKYKDIANYKSLLGDVSKLVVTCVASLSDRKITDEEMKEIVKQLTNIVNIIKCKIGDESEVEDE